MVKSRPSKPRQSLPPKPIEFGPAELLAALEEAAVLSRRDFFFEHPWRRGEAPVSFALALLLKLMAVKGRPSEEEIQRRADIGGDALGDLWEVVLFLQNRENGRSSRYIAADDLRKALRLDDSRLGKLARAALRCEQLRLTKADGDLYNTVLTNGCGGIEEELIEPLIREARCRDAIGTTTTLRGDAADHLRQAFFYCWDRNLINTAYCLPQVNQGV